MSAGKLREMIKVDIHLKDSDEVEKGGRFSQGNRVEKRQANVRTHLGEHEELSGEITEASLMDLLF